MTNPEVSKGQTQEPDSPDWLDETIESADFITLYLEKIRAIPLLNTEQEIALAMQIESGRTARKALLESPKTSDRELLQATIVQGFQAEEDLITANTRLVLSVAKRYINNGVPLIDLIQEGNMGLILAAKKFDYRREKRFSTHAVWWIRQAILRCLPEQGRSMRVPPQTMDDILLVFRAIKGLTTTNNHKPTLAQISLKTGFSPQKVSELLMHQSRTYAASLDAPLREGSNLDLGDVLPAHDPSPENLVIANEVTKRLHTLLADLPLRHRTILKLHFGLVDGKTYTFKEISEMFGVTREAISSQVQRVISLLKEELKDLK